MKNCPFCKEYGILFELKIIKNCKYYFVCDECDRFWQKKDDIGVNNDPYRFFTHMLLEIGLSGTPDDVEIISKDI